MKPQRDYIRKNHIAHVSKMVTRNLFRGVTKMVRGKKKLSDLIGKLNMNDNDNNHITGSGDFID